MTTFTVQIKDSDAEMVLTILKKFKAKVIEMPRESELTLEIAEALKEIKQIPGHLLNENKAKIVNYKIISEEMIDEKTCDDKYL